MKINAWKGHPFRALGPQTWLVRSDANPGDQLMQFNGQPILIRLLPPKMTSQQKVLLGPRSSKQSDKIDPFQTPQGDPWGGWQGLGSAPARQAPPRVLEGPTETRLQSQDEKIAALQEDMKKLTAVHDATAKQTQQQLVTLESATQQQLQQVSGAMIQLRADLDKSFAQSLQQNTKMMDDRMSELKQLLINNKRSAPQDAADMES